MNQIQQHVHGVLLRGGVAMSVHEILRRVSQHFKPITVRSLVNVLNTLKGNAFVVYSKEYSCWMAAKHFDDPFVKVTVHCTECSETRVLERGSMIPGCQVCFGEMTVDKPIKGKTA